MRKDDSVLVWACPDCDASQGVPDKAELRGIDAPPPQDHLGRMPLCDDRIA